MVFFTARTVAACSLVAVLLSGCVFSRLPSQMPADFSLEVRHSGGMLPYSSDVTYSAAECRYQKSYSAQGEPLTSDFHFTLKGELLSSLYAKLVDGPFDLITTHHEVIYDRGGFQVTVTAGGQTFSVIDGGQTVVDAFWMPSWKAIDDKLAELEAAALEQAGSRVTFRLSPEVQKLPELYIGLDLNSVLNNSENPPETEIKVFPGKYLLTLRAEADDPSPQPVTIDGPRTFSVTWDGSSLAAK